MVSLQIGNLKSEKIASYSLVLKPNKSFLNKLDQIKNTTQYVIPPDGVRTIELNAVCFIDDDILLDTQIATNPDITLTYDLDVWIPPKGDRFTTWEEKDEDWLKPLGLGSMGKREVKYTVVNPTNISFTKERECYGYPRKVTINAEKVYKNE